MGSVTISSTDAIVDSTGADCYTINRLWTATDICGNEKSVTQNITISDSEAPELSFDWDPFWTSTFTASCCFLLLPPRPQLSFDWDPFRTSYFIASCCFLLLPACSPDGVGNVTQYLCVCVCVCVCYVQRRNNGTTHTNTWITNIWFSVCMG